MAGSKEDKRSNKEKRNLRREAGGTPHKTRSRSGERGSTEVSEVTVPPMEIEDHPDVVIDREDANEGSGGSEEEEEVEGRDVEGPEEAPPSVDVIAAPSVISSLASSVLPRVVVTQRHLASRLQSAINQREIRSAPSLEEKLRWIATDPNRYRQYTGVSDDQLPAAFEEWRQARIEQHRMAGEEEAATGIPPSRVLQGGEIFPEEVRLLLKRLLSTNYHFYFAY